MRISKRASQQAGHYLRALTTAEHIAAAGGFTLNHVAILRLLNDREPLSNSDISCALDLSCAMVTRCMDKLIAFELVRASLDEADLRKNSFRLEARGRAVLFEIQNSLSEGIALYEALCVQQALMRVQQMGKRGNPNIPTGIAPQGWRVLVALAVGLATVGTLADRADITQPRVSVALRELVQKKLAFRHAASASCDARCHSYELTSEGTTLCRLFLAMVKDALDQENQF